jgi:hypothetical protein
MYYNYGPHSRDYGYDDDYGGYSSPLKLWEYLLAIPLVFVFSIVMAAVPWLYGGWYVLKAESSTLRKIVASGMMSVPSLRIGIFALFLAFVLALLSFPPAHISISLYLIIAVILVLFFSVLPVFAFIMHWARRAHIFLSKRIGAIKTAGIYIIILGAAIAAFFLYHAGSNPPRSTPPPVLPSPTTEVASSPNPIPTSTPISTSAPQRTTIILVDDFIPQPNQGDQVYFYNRLEGDRGALNNSFLDLGNGQVKATIGQGMYWGGLWMSLNHPIREGLGVNFSAILPSQILPVYQSKITGIDITIAGGTANKTFRVELKENAATLMWSKEVLLDGGRQTLQADLPPLQNISQLVLVLDHVSAGDFVIIDNISLIATTPVMDTATAGFVWSYGMLLNNWNHSTGLVRDKSRDASGELDAVQATGGLAAATALAARLGVISKVDAEAIVNQIGTTLLDKLPRKHGLWPHWIKTDQDGSLEIVPGTEWSSVDSVIAAIGLLEAQQILGVDTSRTERMLKEIDWSNLLTEKGLSHGYTYDNTIIPYTWDVFGGESWLVELAYASATGQVAPLPYPSVATANGSGFIDELAWLFVPPPEKIDYWGNDWVAYRSAAAEKQITYYPTVDKASCMARLGLFGLSAAEVPVPAQVSKDSIYQAFGMGGQFASVNDGSSQLGTPVIVPHYSAMIASLQPQTTVKMWDWLIAEGHFSPLNNVESMTFPIGSNCTPAQLEWNHLKGSWNLLLQTLGWGRYLSEQKAQEYTLWQAVNRNIFLLKGYLVLAPHELMNGNSIKLSGFSLAAYLESRGFSCEGKPGSSWSLPGFYQYRITDMNGENSEFSVEQTSEGGLENAINVESIMFKLDSTICPCAYETNKASSTEQISRDGGVFQASRQDTSYEYHWTSMNYPSGKVNESQWSVCGLGLVHAEVDHEAEYQSRPFQRHSELDLVSYAPLP